MHQNIWWRAFLSAVVVITLGYSVFTLYRYYVYSSLSNVVVANHMDWAMDQRGESDFVIGTIYHYAVANVSYKGTHVWEQRRLLNRYAADQAIAEEKAKSWDVWYNQKDPSWSTLERNFPFKEVFSSLFLWGLVVYFALLGLRVGRKKD